MPSRASRQEAWPEAANADELHDALVWLGFITEAEATREAGWQRMARGAGDAEAGRPARPSRRARSGSPPSACRSSPASGPMRSLKPDIEAPAALASRLGRARGPDRDRARPAGGSGAGHGGRSGASLGVDTRRRWRRPWRRCRRKASPCAAGSRPVPARTSGASAGCWRASTATPSSGCAPRSSRSRPATSCASCWRGSTSTPRRAWRVREALEEIVEQLEGFEAPAGAWEKEILAARAQRLQGGLARRRLPVRPRDMDAPRNGTGRANGAARRSGAIKSTPIALLPRQHVAVWRAPAEQGNAGRRHGTCADGRRLHPPARRLVLRRHRGGHRACSGPRSRMPWPSWSPSAW